MKNKKHFIIILGILIFAAKSWAWTERGNGGGTWVCRNNDTGRIQWSELVDLFEAKDEFGLQMQNFQGSTKEIVQALLPKLNRMLSGIVPDATKEVERLHFLMPDPPQITYVQEKLFVINDSFYILSPNLSSCKNGKINFEQVVNYQDNGNILVQSELFDSLSPTNQAALIFHEGIYAALRKNASESNSVYTRHVVGLLLSTLTVGEIQSQLIPQSRNALPLNPGIYKLVAEHLDNNGNLYPFHAKSISIFVSVNSACNAHDGDTVLLDSSEHPTKEATLGVFFSKFLCLNIDGDLYSAPLTMVKWSNNFSPRRLLATHYHCIEFMEKEARPTLKDIDSERNPGKIKIICADK